jgi:hypothetical protein
MLPETKIDCETKKPLSLSEKLDISNWYRDSLFYIFDMVTITFACHQKPHSLQPNQNYGNLVTNIPKSQGVTYF